ncbi:hypothetical protein BS78_09G031400 [Paspalum vaginatum]|nr:hypothetical protein BS78_09G031400 [Paspalum vaginatum]
MRRNKEVDIVKVSSLRKLRKEVDEHLISGKEYEARLRGQHAKLSPFTGWANMDRKTPHPGASDADMVSHRLNLKSKSAS